MVRTFLFVFLLFFLPTSIAFACKDIRGKWGDRCDPNAEKMLNAFSQPDEKIWITAWRIAGKGQTETLLLYTDCRRPGRKNMPCLSTRMSAVFDKKCNLMFVREVFDSSAEMTEWALAEEKRTRIPWFECACNHPKGIKMDGTVCGR